MVMVRVVSHKNQKSPEYDILRYLNSPELRSVETNHTIPLLQEVHCREWTFLVLPYLGEHIFDEVKPFYMLQEVTIFLQQTLEVRKFHANQSHMLIQRLGDDLPS
jgi:hypothetical protein